LKRAASFQDFTRGGFALAAPRCNAQALAQIVHGAHTERNARSDLPIGHGLADADVHRHSFRAQVAPYCGQGLDVTNENDYRLVVSQLQPPRQTNKGAVDPASEDATSAASRRVTSNELLGPGRELVIVHGGREYRLRLTQNGKLILTA
jgi:hemin uptake protein HemP